MPTWLSYHSGSIKAALVTACVLSAALIALTNLSFVIAIPVAITSAAAIMGGLAWWQLRLNARNVHPIRVFNHPDLGRISVYRNSWQAQVQAFGLPYPSTLMGVGGTSVPTSEQISLWRAICERHQSLLEAAYHALSGVGSVSRGVPLTDCHLSLIQLHEFDTFMFFLTSTPRLDSKPGGYFVRYKAMAVIEAGRTPWRAKRA